MIITSSNEVHAPEVMVHLKVFEPGPRLVTAELYKEGSVTVPDPPITDHVPVPITGRLALTLELSLQRPGPAH